MNRWRSWRRRTMAPNRPLLFPEQYGIAMVTAFAIVGGIVFVLVVVF